MILFIRRRSVLPPRGLSGESFQGRFLTGIHRRPRRQPEKSPPAGRPSASALLRLCAGTGEPSRPPVFFPFPPLSVGSTRVAASRIGIRRRSAGRDCPVGRGRNRKKEGIPAVLPDGRRVGRKVAGQTEFPEAANAGAFSRATAVCHNRQNGFLPAQRINPFRKVRRCRFGPLLRCFLRKTV